MIHSAILPSEKLKVIEEIFKNTPVKIVWVNNLGITHPVFGEADSDPVVHIDLTLEMPADFSGI